MEVQTHLVAPARGAGEGDVKLRSVCDACTSAKLRCNGKTPCERCIKKGIQCHYQPFKHRGGGGSDKAKTKAAASNGDEFGDSFMDEYERKTWSVFFTLYRSFSKGCSLFWFKQQLFRMLKFLETRAGSDAPAANALLRLKSWMIALGLDVTNPPACGRSIPKFQFQKTTIVNFQSTLDDLNTDAQKRNLPMLSISENGEVVVNDAFTAAFEPSQEVLQRAVDDAGGGFLPWGGDLLARILSKENDLVLYIQSVSDAMDAIGRPTGVPLIQVIPTMNVVRARKRGGQDVLCILRGIQRLSFQPDDISFSTLIVFELPEGSSSEVPSRARPFSETTMAAAEDAEFNKLVETEPSDILPLPMDALSGPGDEEWLDSLLDWANETSDGNGFMSMLPVSDESWH